MMQQRKLSKNASQLAACLDAGHSCGSSFFFSPANHRYPAQSRLAKPPPGTQNGSSNQKVRQRGKTKSCGIWLTNNHLLNLKNLHG
jgi:hypothetical protein